MRPQMRFHLMLLAAMALSVTFLLSRAPVARADDECQKRIVKAHHNLHEAIEHHGPQSSQAEHWRHELAEARSYCWEHGHRWWDEDDRRWHTNRDWDGHDHDHGPDHP